MQQDYCAITLFNTRLLTMNTINQKSYNLIKTHFQFNIHFVQMLKEYKLMLYLSALKAN